MSAQPNQPPTAVPIEANFNLVRYVWSPQLVEFCDELETEVGVTSDNPLFEIRHPLPSIPKFTARYAELKPHDADNAAKRFRPAVISYTTAQEVGNIFHRLKKVSSERVLDDMQEAFPPFSQATNVTFQGWDFPYDKPERPGRRSFLWLIMTPDSAEYFLGEQGMVHHIARRNGSAQNDGRALWSRQRADQIAIGHNSRKDVDDEVIQKIRRVITKYGTIEAEASRLFQLPPKGQVVHTEEKVFSVS